MAIYPAETQDSVKKEGGKLYWLKIVSATPLFFYNVLFYNFLSGIFYLALLLVLTGSI